MMARLERKITDLAELIHAYIQTNVNRQLMRPYCTAQTTLLTLQTQYESKEKSVLVYVNVNPVPIDHIPGEDENAV